MEKFFLGTSFFFVVIKGVLKCTNSAIVVKIMKIIQTVFIFLTRFHLYIGEAYFHYSFSVSHSFSFGELRDYSYYHLTVDFYS